MFKCLIVYVEAYTFNIHFKYTSNALRWNVLRFQLYNVGVLDIYYSNHQVYFMIEVSTTRIEPEDECMERHDLRAYMR